METKSHWENIYAIKVPSEVSWFQEHPTVSRGLIRRTGVAPSVSIIDVGGGASTLVDDLLADGFQNLTVLDISAAALQIARERLGPQAAAAVTWLEADITSVRLPAQRFDVWHDRAVFHFLTRKEDR
jgi:ubiquinone/menaquinone biosynthesis C-methylase UbiE